MIRLVQQSKTHDGITITGLNELLEFTIGDKRRIRLTAMSAAPTAANTVIQIRLGYQFTQSDGTVGSIDFAWAIAGRYRPVVFNQPIILEGPGKLYAAALAELDSTVDPYTFNVVYEVLQ